MKKKPLLFSALVSIVCGVLVFSLFRNFMGDGQEYNLSSPGSSSAFAVLVFDESLPDRQIQDALALGGIGGIISESSQTLVFDNFGSLKTISLDIYENEIPAFDPRNDGYAAKLKNFFIHDGKRFFFLPLKDGSLFNINKLKKQLVSALPNTPFALEIPGNNSSLLWHFLLLFAASGCAFCFSRQKRLYALVLPLLLAFGAVFQKNSAAAFIFAAFLSGIWELLREPLRELLRPAYGFHDHSAVKMKGGRLKPFALNIMLVVVFLLLYTAYFLTMEFPLILLAAGLCPFLFVCFFSFKIEAAREKKLKHALFCPIPLLPFKARTFSLFPHLLPFCAGAVLVMFLPQSLPGISSFNSYPIQEAFYPESGRLINAEDYYRHINFQKSFSFRPLYEEFAFSNEGYENYYLGDDGLIAGSSGYSIQDDTDIAPFPLEKLMDFLSNYGKLNSNRSGVLIQMYDESPVQMFKEWIFVIIVLTVTMLDLLRPHVRVTKAKKTHILRDRRAAA